MDYFRLAAETDKLNNENDYYIELASILWNLGSAYLTQKLYPLSAIYYFDECLTIKKDKLKQIGEPLNKVNAKLKQAQLLLEEKNEEKKIQEKKQQSQRQTKFLFTDEKPLDFIQSSKPPLISRDSPVVSHEQKQKKILQNYEKKLIKAQKSFTDLCKNMENNNDPLSYLDDILEWTLELQQLESASDKERILLLSDLDNFIEILEKQNEKYESPEINILQN